MSFIRKSKCIPLFCFFFILARILTWPAETWIGCLNKIQVTDSVQGGVVSEPGYVQYPFGGGSNFRGSSGSDSVTLSFLCVTKGSNRITLSNSSFLEPAWGEKRYLLKYEYNLINLVGNTAHKLISRC